MKKILALIAALACATAPLTSAAPSGETAAASGQAGVSLREESVYSLLGADGAPQRLTAVVRLRVDSPGRYTDTGRYGGVVNLTDTLAPEIGAEGVTWAFAAPYDEFYYQGDLTGVEPPFGLRLSCTLNGAAVRPDELAGASGAVVLALDVLPNPSTAACFAKGYMAQLQLSLPAGRCDVLDAGGGVSVLSGGTRTLSFTVLPGKEASFAVTLRAAGFEMDPVTLSMMPYNLSELLAQTMPNLDLDEFSQGIDDLGGGVDELAAGTQALKDGTRQLWDGLNQAAASAEQLAGPARQLALGMKQLNTAMDEYKALFEMYISGGGQYVKILDSLNDGAQKLSDGVGQLEEALKEMSGSAAALPAGADKLLAGQSELRDGIAQLGRAVDEIPSLLTPGGGELPPLVSFVTGGAVDSVQFVSRTPAIAAPQPERERPPEEAPKSFWDRLLDLFR